MIQIDPILDTIRAELSGLAAEVSAAREKMALALIRYIDASMPPEADFVNYKLTMDETYLVISEALGEYGTDLDVSGFGHTADALRQLGQPYYHFDGDLVMVDSIDDFGWERTAPFDSQNAEIASADALAATEAWGRAVDTLQDSALRRVWELVPADVDALDVAVSDWGDPTNAAGAITAHGRLNLARDDSEWAHASEILRFVELPERTNLQYNELSGHYRLVRP